jgi:hypothetical protein
MRAEVSPAASRVIASARPLSGRVTLKNRPIAAATQPTQVMICLVRACDTERAAEAAAARSRASFRIWSASGSTLCVLLSIDSVREPTFSTPLTHWPNVSA